MYYLNVLFIYILLLLIYCPNISSSLPSYHQYHLPLIQDGYIRLTNILPEEEIIKYRTLIYSAMEKELHDCRKCSLSSSTTTANLHDLTDPICSTCDTTTLTSDQSIQKSFYRYRRLLSYEPTLQSLYYSPILGRIAAQIMNVSKVRFYQSTIFIKYPNDQPSAWHQDSAAIPLHSDKIITLWLNLDTVYNTSGILRFIKYSHLSNVSLPSLRNIPLVQRLSSMQKWTDEDINRLLPNAIIDEPPLIMNIGSGTFHLGWTLHGSKANTSPILRPAVAITYFADGARIHPELLRVEELSTSSSSNEPDNKGIKLSTQDGTSIIVRLLADDKATWLKWLQARPPILIPGSPVKDDRLTPIIYDSTKDEEFLQNQPSQSNSNNKKNRKRKREKEDNEL